MSVALSVPSSPVRLPIAGKLTIAHLRVRPAPSEAIVRLPAEPSRDVQRAPRCAALPLKADKPRRLEPVQARRAPAAEHAPLADTAHAPVVTPVKPASASPGAAKKAPKRPALTEKEAFLRDFHRAAHELWPSAFPMRGDLGDKPLSPLAIGVGAEVVDGLKHRFPRERVDRWMKNWTARTAYLRGIVHHHKNGLPRVRLDGTPSDDPRDIVTPGQAKHARHVVETRELRWRQAESGVEGGTEETRPAPCSVAA